MNNLLDVEKTIETASEPGGQITPETGNEAEAETKEGEGDANACPDWLPEKFWDAETGEVRLENLAKSYVTLEQRFGEAGGGYNGVPESPDEYKIKLGEEEHDTDPEIAARLHKAGFTFEQVQMIHDLGVEQLTPVVMDLDAKSQGDQEAMRLREHFGGDQRWAETADKIITWGKANLDPQTFETLSCSFDGVLAMHQMMGKGEPSVIGRGTGGALFANEAELRKLMRDPRYWREREPGVVAQVRSGYEKLYPDA